ncbi:hypothetical protein C4D60_Mb09t02450 [Musa balbisiana]|uniref:Uncharacterized protein n=1 Tax=Musa balbisiana TaxID=52838 RepID=A0A4S8IDL0_MUSBA|nr:hypothetical protein C4D60_Mb09t02450 [Musa balbisiana]
MPQVKDLEALVCGGGETKVACETQIGADDPDLPPESIVVRIGSGRELFWAEVGGAAVYERDDSTKGNTNPKAQAQQQHANPASRPRSNSQRFSGGLQAKPPIIGIPGKIQHHSGYLGRSGRRPANAPIFPKKPPRPDRGGGERKSALPDEEPGSPKVSCIGKVLSERERERDRYRRQCRGSPEQEEEAATPSGCWAMFFCGGAKQRRRSAASETVPVDSPAKAAVDRRTAAEPRLAAPGLGSMMRFSSGRRPASWGGDGDVSVDLEPLDGEATELGGRRSLRSREDAKR